MRAIDLECSTCGAGVGEECHDLGLSVAPWQVIDGAHVHSQRVLQAAQRGIATGRPLPAAPGYLRRNP